MANTTNGCDKLQEIMEQIDRANLSEVLATVEAIAEENNLQIPPKPDQSIFSALDDEDKIRLVKELISKAIEQLEKPESERRKCRLLEAFEEFCKKNGTTEEEMASIINGEWNDDKIVTYP
jgi:hypothetical protein